MRILIPLFLVIIAVAYWALADRSTAEHVEPASRQPSSVGVRLPTVLHDFKNVLLGPKFNLQTCGHTLETARAKPFAFADFYDYAKLQPKNLMPLVSSLFEINLLLRTRMKEFGDELKKNDTCQLELRHTFQQLRALEDLLGEQQLDFPDEDDDGRPHSLSGPAPYMMVADPATPFELRSGDVLLSRGTTFVSTAVARLGGPDSLLTHLEIVYVDPVTKKTWVMGSSIDAGLLIRPLESFLKANRVRLLVYRFFDTTVAQKTAEEIFRHVGNDPPQVAPELFGADLIGKAYAHAAPKMPGVPQILSILHAEHSSFVKHLDIRDPHIFLPGDIEMDWRFNLVAEWRDLGLINISRMRDAVLSSIFDWMEHDDYVLKDDSDKSFAKLLVDHLPTWPIFPSRSNAELPVNMSPEMITAFKELNAISEVLYAHLEKVAELKKDPANPEMSSDEMRSELEKFRLADLKVFDEYQKTHDYDPLAKKPSFHLLFRR